MAERKLFYDEIRNTSRQCTIEDLKKDLLNSKAINDFEKDFQSCIVELHQDESTYTESAKLTMMYVQVKKDLPQEEKNKMNILFFRAELAAHGNNRSLAENSMRKHVEWVTVKEIVESVEPGIITRITEHFPSSIRNFWDASQRSTAGSWVSYVSLKYIHFLNLYLDLIKDGLLFIGLVVRLTPGSFLNLCNITEFSHQLLWLLLFSVICPVMTSSLNVARNPSIFFGFELYEDSPSALMKWKFLPLGLLLCPLVPIFFVKCS